eukprot:1029229-Pelagomonas_calceolata.AAC.2
MVEMYAPLLVWTVYSYLPLMACALHCSTPAGHHKVCKRGANLSHSKFKSQLLGAVTPPQALHVQKSCNLLGSHVYA